MSTRHLSFPLLALAALLALPGCNAGADGAAPGIRAPESGVASPDSADLPAGSYFNDGGDGDVRARSESVLEKVELEFEEEPGTSFDELVVAYKVPDGVTYPTDRVAALQAKFDREGQEPAFVPLPLKHTAYDGRIDLNLSAVEVVQSYHNPFDRKIEAVYSFPLPQGAAVHDFLLVIGNRRIRGIIREKEEANRIYEAARARGHVASLLDQVRPNIFEQKVANIEPGHAIDIEIHYFQALPYRDGAFELVVPTVVGPRFNPPGSDGGVGAVGLEAGRRPGSSGQDHEVSYLGPDQVSGHRISLEFAIDAGLPIRDITCASHPVTVERPSGSTATVALKRGTALPNKDFVLRYALDERDLQAAVAVHRDPGGKEGTFALLVHPPAEQALETLGGPAGDDGGNGAGPREMVFVIDCSGSMSGEPLATCKRTVRRCLERLGPDDTFNVMRFSNAASAFRERPVPADDANREAGLRYLDELRASGGTMMSHGIRASLRDRADGKRRRIVTFMTDGFIGNEAEILGLIHDGLRDTRIFAFGVGSSPNRYLMERMAKMGRGVAAFVGNDESGAEQVDRLYRRLENPALSDLSFDFGDARVTAMEPGDMPDLFPGRPVTIFGRFRGELPAEVRIQGRQGVRSIAFTATLGASRENVAIPKLWARTRIAGLSDRMAWVSTPDELAQEIETLALRHGLMSAYTSYVAVDSASGTEGDTGTRVHQAVPTPEGVRYDTTVGSGGGH